MTVLEATTHRLQIAGCDVSLGAEGLRDYAWPVAAETIRQARDRLARLLTEDCRGQGMPEDQRDLVIALLFHILLNMTSVCQGIILADHAARQSLRFTPRTWPILSALLNNETPPSPLLRELARGWPRSPTWRRPLRVLRSWLKPDGLSRLHYPWRGNPVVATTTSELIYAHAKMQAEPVLYCGFDRWFQPLTPQPLTPAARAVGEHVANRVDAVVRDVLGSSPAWLANYFRGWVGTAAAQVEAHLQRGERFLQPRPREVWTGSGGMLWTRMLRILMRRAGIPVVGHDHGSGAGHREARYKALTDFENLDRFVTFSPGQARHLKAHQGVDHLLNRTLPDMIGLDGFSRLQPQVAATGIERVIYVCSLPRGEVMGIYPRLSDFGFIDFEARMVSHLSRWYSNVVLKPHPGRSLHLPPGFVTERGVRVESRPLEQIWQPGDLLVFDDHLSTAFASALRTTLPVVLVDFGYDEFTFAGRQALDSRISIVRGQIDGENRAQVDWDAVKTAASQSLEKSSSPVFFDEFFR